MPTSTRTSTSNSERYPAYAISDCVLISRLSYLGVFCIFVAGSCLTYTVGISVYVFGIIRAARKIHKQLINSILGTTLRWLDT